MLGQRRAQPLEVTQPERHRAAPSRALGRVRKAHEALALLGLEQLHERSEPLLAGALRQRHLLDGMRRTPRCRDRLGSPLCGRHEPQRRDEIVTRGKRRCDETATYDAGVIQIGSIVLRVDDLERQAAFWEAALGYVRREGDADDWALLRPRDGNGPTLALDRHH